MNHHRKKKLIHKQKQISKSFWKPIQHICILEICQSAHRKIIHCQPEFIHETVKKKFIDIIGDAVLNNITVTRYSSNKGSINDIEVIVSFNVPISYQYLSDFKFPVNWHFFKFIARPIEAKRKRN